MNRDASTVRQRCQDPDRVLHWLPVTHARHSRQASDLRHRSKCGPTHHNQNTYRDIGEVQMHFTVTGHCCLDLVIRNSMDENGEDAWADSSPMEARAGGATANVGRALASIGVDVSLYCALAEDGIGSATSLLLEQSQFATLHIERVPATGSYSLVIDSPGMDRTFRHHIGANRYFDPAKVEVRETTWLHFGYPSLTPSVLLEDGLPLKSLFERAQSAGARTSLDLAAVPSSMRDTHQKWRQFFRNVLPATDVFAPSWEDLTAVGFDTGQFTTQNVRRVGGESLAMGGSTVSVRGGWRVSGFPTC